MTSEFSSDGRGNGRRRHKRIRLLRKDIKELKEALYKVQQELEVTTTILLDECYNLNMQIRQLGGGTTVRRGGASNLVKSMQQTEQGRDSRVSLKWIMEIDT